MEYPKFKVTVSCMTYNQSKYITDAMNGFTMQQTSFPYVCTIVDDASTDGEQEVIHQYVEEKTEATCTEGGVTKLVCTVCGECIISSEEEALGHDMVDKVIREGTCTRSGIVIHQCSRCGRRETEIVPASGHDYKTVTDSHGHTKQVCTVCGHTKNSFDKFFSWISGFFPRPY